jgi:hypothetical protein
MQQLGAQNTQNNIIVLWWYRDDSSDRDTRAVGTLELFPLENNSNRVVLRREQFQSPYAVPLGKPMKCNFDL